jgi:hypothetical protein
MTQDEEVPASENWLVGYDAVQTGDISEPRHDLLGTFCLIGKA